MSCVRSNDYKNIGFCKDKRRMNVAFTRAKYGLIIVGNKRSLKRE
jgi:regulator of nonsense transcripts 1